MEKARILFFADTHLGFDHPIRASTKTNRRGPDFFKNFESILETATKEKVDLVIHGGDLFDRSKVHRSIVHKAYDRLFEFADAGIPLVLIPGNHDRSTLPSSLFLQHPNLIIFFEPQVHSFKLNGLDLHIGGFPFVRNIGQEIIEIVQSLEKELPEGGVSMLLMHQAVQDAKVGPANYTFQPGPQVIRKSDLTSKFQLVLSGHIHRYQIIPIEHQSAQIPFVYPGSIERTSFAEIDEEKGFVFIELATGLLPKFTFQPLLTRSMHVLKIGDAEMAFSTLAELLRDKLSEIDSSAILRIDSPTERISKWLSNAGKKIIPESIFLQIRHQWIDRSGSWNGDRKKK